MNYTKKKKYDTKEDIPYFIKCVGTFSTLSYI